MKILRVATKFFDRLIETFAVFSAIIIVFSMLLVCTDVTMRYLFNKPIHGIIEITEYGLLFFTFFAVTWVLREEGHVSIDIMIETLNPRNRALVDFFTSLVCAVACIIMVVYGLRVAWELFSFNVHFSTQLKPPAYIIILIIPLGYLLLFAQLIRRMHRFFQSYVTPKTERMDIKAMAEKGGV